MISLLLNVMLIPAMPLNVVLALMLFGIAYSVLVLKLQRTFSNPKRMMEINKEMKVLIKDMQAAIKRGENVAEHQKRHLTLMNETMKLQLKTTFMIIPLFLVFYYLIVNPIFIRFAADEVVIFGIQITYYWVFIIASMLFGFAAGILLRKRDARRLQAKAMQTIETQAVPTE